MWIINDEKIRELLKNYFDDEDIHDAFRNRNRKKEWVILNTHEGQKMTAFFKVRKELFKWSREYDPNDWNPYPEVKPPRRGYYLVTRLRTRDNGDTYKGVDLCLFGLNNSDIFAQSNVLAFRELPEPYDPMPWEEDDKREPEEGD